MKSLYESIISSNGADHASHVKDIKAKISDKHIENITDYFKHYEDITFKEYLDNVSEVIFQYDIKKLFKGDNNPHIELYFQDGVLSISKSDSNYKIKEIFWVKTKDINKKPILRGYYRKQWNKALKDGYGEVTTYGPNMKTSWESHALTLMNILKEKYKDIIS